MQESAAGRLLLCSDVARWQDAEEVSSVYLGSMYGYKYAQGFRQAKVKIE